MPNLTTKKEKIPDKKDDVLYNADAENKVAIEVAEILQSIIGKDLKSLEIKHLNKIVAGLEEIFQNNDSAVINQSVNAIVDNIVEFNSKQGKEIGDAVEKMTMLHYYVADNEVCDVRYFNEIYWFLLVIGVTLVNKKKEINATNPLNETSLGPDELKKYYAGSDSIVQADALNVETLSSVNASSTKTLLRFNDFKDKPSTNVSGNKIFSKLNAFKDKSLEYVLSIKTPSGAAISTIAKQETSMDESLADVSGNKIFSKLNAFKDKSLEYVLSIKTPSGAAISTIAKQETSMDESLADELSIKTPSGVVASALVTQSAIGNNGGIVKRKVRFK